MLNATFGLQSSEGVECYCCWCFLLKILNATAADAFLWRSRMLLLLLISFEDLDCYCCWLLLKILNAAATRCFFWRSSMLLLLTLFQKILNATALNAFFWKSWKMVLVLSTQCLKCHWLWCFIRKIFNATAADAFLWKTWLLNHFRIRSQAFSLKDLTIGSKITKLLMKIRKTKNKQTFKTKNKQGSI